jgi:hypothetical protein
LGIFPFRGSDERSRSRHGKPQFLPEIEKDVQALGRKGIRFLKTRESLEI